MSDILFYTAPCSLTKYLKQWATVGQKSIFPHSHFSSIEEINRTIEFPPREAFYSELKRANVPQDEYDEAKNLYDTRLHLPDGHDDKWNNFSDWLKFYNMCDVEPLVTAIVNQFEKFRVYFNIEPIIYMTLPSIASQAMWANFDQQCSHVVSFDRKNSKLNSIFREKGLIGGLVNLFTRHVSCNDNGLPAARFINWQRITNIISLDFNSLYLYSQNQLLPTTPGIQWSKRSNGYFRKKSLRTDISFASLQWLYWLQETDICVDKHGQRQRIHHGYHQGEVCCECLQFDYQCAHRKPVDGYCLVDGQHIFFEFLGCYFHPGCEKCQSSNVNCKEREEAYAIKKAIMREKGRLIEKRSCEWQRNMPAPIKTEMGRVLCRDNEQTLLEAIKNGEFYGFIVCTVTTPLELIQSYDILFPWIIQHQTITELSPYMREQTDKKEFKTLCQTYNGENILLLSSTIKFYMEIGLKISNIGLAVQYKPGINILHFTFYISHLERGLSPFVKKVVNLRSEAKEAKDDAKGLTAKLVGNSGYGKTSENVYKHKQTKLFSKVADSRIACRSPFLRTIHEFITEDLSSMTEVTLDKKKIYDDKPIHIGACILSEAKLLFSKFIHFLQSHLEPGTFKTVYCDTDSITLATIKGGNVDGMDLPEKYERIFGPIIKPSMRQSWDKNMSSWFVLSDAISDTLFPGKLKEEFSTSTGEMICLSPKCYFAYDGEKTKFGTKGVPHNFEIKMDMMRQKLYNNKQPHITLQTLGLKQNELRRYQVEKKALNSIFVKFHLDDDGITCRPLRKNGKYL